MDGGLGVTASAAVAAGNSGVGVDLGVAVSAVGLDGTVLICSTSFFVGGVFEHPESKLM